LKYLLRGAGRGEPEPGGVGGDADHGAAGHEVSDGVGPPGVVVPLVHQVLPGHQLKHGRKVKARTIVNACSGPSISNKRSFLLIFRIIAILKACNISDA